MDKVLTLDHLHSRGWNLANRCIIFLPEEESVDHLFAHFTLMHRGWGFFGSHLSISWFFPSHICDLITG